MNYRCDSSTKRSRSNRTGNHINNTNNKHQCKCNDVAGRFFMHVITLDYQIPHTSLRPNDQSAGSGMTKCL